jgi:ubiquinone/menaquinone biosynthesis C-methylase UbiE
MKKFLNHLVLPFNLSKTILYSTEYRLLYGLSKSVSYLVKPPHREADPQLINHLRQGVINIHKQEAQNIEKGYYPLEVLKPRDPLKHVRLLPQILLDSLLVSRRRKVLKTKDLGQIDEAAPEYLKRNYHFQTDGYFSEKSANFYEHQVEILFSGTAAPMRRMLIKAIKDRMEYPDRPLRILEIGAGVGSATLDFIPSFNFTRYVVSDISQPYLDLAKARMYNPKLEFIKAAGEDLPFADGTFDLVFSVFLFHELPRSVRQKVLKESWRVLNKGGLIGICDSIQQNDDPILNGVLTNFPMDYHEPFYKDFTIWNTTEALADAGFDEITSHHQLLSKYWVGRK